MIENEHEVIISQPVDVVFAYISNPENNQHWQADLIESRLASDGPIGVGSVFEEVRRFVGRALEIKTTREIIRYVPNEEIHFKSTPSAHFEMDLNYAFQPVEEGTQLTLAYKFDIGGFFATAEPLIEKGVVKSVVTDLDKLKEVLEQA
jgi:uncharacterized membrane protein